MDKLRNYFLVKAAIAENLEDAANSLRGLQVSASSFPFVNLQQ